MKGPYRALTRPAPRPHASAEKGAPQQQDQDAYGRPQQGLKEAGPVQILTEKVEAEAQRMGVERRLPERGWSARPGYLVQVAGILDIGQCIADRDLKVRSMPDIFQIEQADRKSQQA